MGDHVDMKASWRMDTRRGTVEDFVYLGKPTLKSVNALNFFFFLTLRDDQEVAYLQ